MIKKECTLFNIPCLREETSSSRIWYCLRSTTSKDEQKAEISKDIKCKLEFNTQNASLHSKQFFFFSIKDVS